MVALNMSADGETVSWTGNHDSIGEDAMSSPVLPVLLAPSTSSGVHNEDTPIESVEGSLQPPQPLPPPPYTKIKMREICHRHTDDESGRLLEPSYNREVLVVPSELQSRISPDDWTEFWSVHMQPLYDDGQLYTRYFVGTAVAIILVFAVLFFVGLNLIEYANFKFNVAFVAALCVANYHYNGWIARVRHRQLKQIRAICRKQEQMFQNVHIQCDYEWFFGYPHDIVMVMCGVVLYFYPKNHDDAMKDNDCDIDRDEKARQYDDDEEEDSRRIQLFSTDPNGCSRWLSELRSHLESYRQTAALQFSPCDRVATIAAAHENDNCIWSVQFWPTMMQHCIAYSSAYFWDRVVWRLVYLSALVNFFFLDDVPLLSDTAELLSNIVLFPIVLVLANFYTPVQKHTCVHQCRSWVQRHAAALQEQYGIHVEFRQVYEFKGGNTACGTMAMYGAHYLYICPA